MPNGYSALRLSLSQIKSVRIDGAVRQAQVDLRRARRTERPFERAHPSLMKGGYAPHCNLAAAGVPVRSVRYNGTIHDFMLLNPIANTPPVRGAVDQASDYLRKVFAGS